ncbi:MAG: lipoprotein-releasing ABC transporter permease subunit [Xanthomonadales bacterium]|nr:lipoprotein-releasing ABC transporter permease subunit [Xanthomonadales bacterium]MBP6078667.1 lipoprotein-releasing ABC transporter permease subunit [Xanthomonadales bacterium]MBP7624942.1 lipoprotein-releasing ABC transporter permease subunit [Xanthomonadales bacterium]
MFRPLELFIGLRYTRAKRRNHFISFISMVSMLGIALGVTALITVISVMNGFEGELRARILGMVSHATVAGVGDGLDEWEAALAKAKTVPHVIGAAPYIEREAMLQGGRVSGAILRGVDPTREREVSEIADRVVEGSWDALKPGEYGIVLGRELALWAGAELGGDVLVYAPQVRATPAGVLPQMRRFKVVGIFEAGMQEYDRGMAVIHMADAAKLFRMGDKVTGVRLKLDDMFKAKAVAADLADQLGGFYRVRDWTREHANFFRAVQTEKTVMFIILSLIVAVAAFNLVSSLVMLVTDKQSDIAILRTLGLSPRSVMGVFVVQGTIIGLVGIALGTIGGVLLADNVTRVMRFLESIFGFELMPADIYYISDLPSDLRWDDVGSIVGLAFVLCLIATLYPAWRAARTHPVEALRYE